MSSISVKSLRKINRIWLIANILFLISTPFFCGGILTSQTYDADPALSKEELLKTLNQFLEGDLWQLLFLVAFVVVNIIVLVLNHSRLKTLLSDTKN